MKIIIDLQGKQSISNGNRGIGRYSLSLTKSILEQNKNHEIIIVLTSLILDAVQSVKNELKGLIDEKNIYVWGAPSPVSYIDSRNDTKRNNAEMLRETFIASLNPDIVLITSLFEGLSDNTTTSIHKLPYNIPTATILYDLIPLINKSPYLDNPNIKKWYEEKINYLKKSDLLLSISESSRKEALDYLNFDPQKVVNISTASDPQFQKVDISNHKKLEILDKYEIKKDFLMYTGGIDHRKNIEGLIRAYALVDAEIRSTHQLAIVCSITEEQQDTLLALAKSKGLHKNEMIFTGYIPEDDLIVLYNLCKAFIFPSWHEGFGLPVLEAMNCGAPAIVSNKSSLPEVVGNKEALFDAQDDIKMSKKIEELLSNESFRNRLITHNKEQIKKFSWNETARKAIAALENYFTESKVEDFTTVEPKRKLAYISPLPPERSGISDYSAELLQSLIEYYDIDVIENQENISDTWITDNCSVHDIKYFKNHASNYDRILYHFGNSHFHQHMFSLLSEFPGTVVLHDFYLSGIVNHMSMQKYENFDLKEELYYSHGYKPFVTKENDLLWDYPINKRVLDHAKGVIVHSKNSINLAHKWYGKHFAKDWYEIPLLRIGASNKSIDIRTKLNIPEDAFVVCSFGILNETKQNQKLLDTWVMSSLSKNKNSYLIFVGELGQGEYGLHLEKAISSSEYTNQIKITGWVDTDTFSDYLSIADVAVQLRALSRGETSAAVLDCMNYGIPTIVNANGSMADLDEETVYKIQDDFILEELQKALEELYNDDNKRKVLGDKAKECISDKHAPEKCARQYFEAIEGFYKNIINEDTFLMDSLVSENDILDLTNQDLKKLAKSISINHPYPGEKQLLVDISQLHTIDDKSGIQRVVKNILHELLKNMPDGYRIEPIYATVDNIGYKYAKNFTLNFLNQGYEGITDEAIDFKKGDIFLALDLSHNIPVYQNVYYKKLRAHGVKTCFVVYDMLPILNDKFFIDGALQLHTNWLNVVKENDLAICISQSVENELKSWLNHNSSEQNICSTSSFHLGADLDNSLPSKGLPSDTIETLNHIKSKRSFLMVGTIEPRKGHNQTLEAFEKLWSQDINTNLIIVGKQGWLVDELIKKLADHPELNKRLFWLDSISDEYLEKMYSASTCLLAASEGEGFGLPLIEAAQKKKPIIARDIPVFREVAGEYAYYFENSKDPKVLASAIERWIELYKENKHPKSDNMPWLTWRKSAEQLLDCLEIKGTKC